MIYSMTGFGKADITIDNSSFNIEVKSVNGKNAELNIRLPLSLKSFEIEIRKMVSEKLIRGSIELTIYLKENGSTRPIAINKSLAKSYYLMMSEMADEFELDKKDLLNTILKMPEIFSQDTEPWEDEKFDLLKNSIATALQEVMNYRLIEGQKLYDTMVQNATEIISLSSSLEKFEPYRIEFIKSKLIKSLGELELEVDYDKNRMEQELIYYIEKLDVSEEKQRLAANCSYFLEALSDTSEISKGKKLNFISQEIGREINTLGSKSNQSDMQKIVVQMKESLEKIKEQVLNIL